MPTLSLVTCTRSPDPALLSRVVAAVAALEVPAGWTREYLLIDSASGIPLVETDLIRSFLRDAPWARVLRTDAPGLAIARRLAVLESAGSLLVWFDDDNVPAPDYLGAVIRVATERPQVSVWGAGRIHVEFTGPVAPWVEREMRPFFQERRHAADEFGSAQHWATFFPVGSGMVTRREAIVRWAAASAQGRYSLTGRSGTRLSAGDDAQIVFGAVAAGELVGVVAAQSLVHLIPPARCTEDYLARLEFGLAASLRVARAECFGSEHLAVREDLSVIAGVRAALKARRVHGADGARFARFELARRLGAVAGTLQTQHRPEPWWLRAAIAAMGLR